MYVVDAYAPTARICQAGLYTHPCFSSKKQLNLATFECEWGLELRYTGRDEFCLKRCISILATWSIISVHIKEWLIESRTWTLITSYTKIMAYFMNNDRDERGNELVFNFASSRYEQLPLHEKLASQHDKLPSFHDQLFPHGQIPVHEQILLTESSDAQAALRMFPNQYFYPETLASLNPVFNSSAINAEHFYSRSSASRHNFSVVQDNSSPTEIGPALAWNPCLYFARGFCKNGSNCRFLHGPMNENPGSSCSATAQREMRGEEGIASGSLEKLEMELQELSRGRRGSPVPIASLPRLYYKRFRKHLQVEECLPESQRPGIDGYSLTKLLARLKNTVTLIDGPHGQPAVVLTGDARRFTVSRGHNLSGVNPSSREIFIKFPAESSFTVEDATSYFRAYGTVQDVRIPYQQKRMFGFLTFVDSETIKSILSVGNLHYICGDPVLVVKSSSIRR